MAQEYDNTNSGALFKNEEKETDKHPDYRGEVNVEGSEFWLSAWIKKSKAGKTYMSLALKPKEERPQARRGGKDPEEANRKLSELDDDIPF